MRSFILKKTPKIRWDAAKKSAEVQNFTNSPNVSQMLKNIANWTGLVNPQIEDFGVVSVDLSIEVDPLRIWFIQTALERKF